MGLGLALGLGLGLGLGRAENGRGGEIGEADVRRGAPLHGRALAGAGGRGSPCGKIRMHGGLRAVAGMIACGCRHARVWLQGKVAPSGSGRPSWRRC